MGVLRSSSDEPHGFFFRGCVLGEPVDSEHSYDFDMFGNEIRVDLRTEWIWEDSRFPDGALTVVDGVLFFTEDGTNTPVEVPLEAELITENLLNNAPLPQVVSVTTAINQRLTALEDALAVVAVEVESVKPDPTEIDPVLELKNDLTAAIKAAPNTIAGVKAAILGAVT